MVGRWLKIWRIISIKFMGFVARSVGMKKMDIATTPLEPMTI